RMQALNPHRGRHAVPPLVVASSAEPPPDVFGALREAGDVEVPPFAIPDHDEICRLFVVADVPDHAHEPVPVVELRPPLHPWLEPPETRVRPQREGDRPLWGYTRSRW